MIREGIFFVISAPSGAGKTSLCKEIIDIFPELRQSVSYTTRSARAGEVHGVDYYFVSPETFDRMIADGAFAEWAEVHGNRYGTAIETLQTSRAMGNDLLLDIDCQGARQIKEKYGEGVFIFILPPSIDELKRRLLGRNTDSSETIEQRIRNAEGEIREASWYDYLIVNDDFQKALVELKSIILAEGCRAFRLAYVQDELLTFS